MGSLILGDCIEELKKLSDNSIDAVITDPPYELGFMGKKWDNTGIAYKIDLWKEIIRVLKPGGHLLSFGGSRTYHRMACAIEDAGFEIRDQIMWVYGSGFPKSHNIGKAVDKLQGNKREVTGTQKLGGTAATLKGKANRKDWYDQGDGGTYTPEIQITKGTSEWEGYGTALKPAHEPIVLARKPLSEKTVALNCLKWGVGGLNIDGCRVGTEEITVNRHSGYNSNSLVESTKGKWKGEQEQVSGRFPANFIHDGIETEWSRFFYCPKASKKERNMGCEGLEEKVAGAMCANEGKTMDLGGASLKGEHKQIQTKKNHHPTVKPLALMKYLVKLISKEGQTVLDPFMGSGTTGIACKELNRDFIGIEKEPEYMEIAKRRIQATKEQYEDKQ